MRLPLGLLPIVAAARKPSVLVLLGDDIGWGDVSYNGGAAVTRNIDAWAAAPGSITFQDAHSGGTVCSPTRATILTGRNHFRDCVDYVYDCSDPTECDPGFPFAQTGTFTIADAAKAAGHRSFFAGKWHLGSFYADAPYPSSPLVHGFDRMHATLEVAPTATTNCMCSAAWNASCEFGHDGGPEHCTGGFAAGGPDGCCFNYWFEDNRSEHGVGNMTRPSHAIDAVEVQQSLSAFLKTVDDDAGFVAQLSFHNCHIPFVGAAATVAACRDGDGCLPENRQGQPKTNYSAAQLDFYACLLELDAAVGAVLRDLRDFKRYDDTLVYFTTDNGPEGDRPRGTHIFNPTSTVSTRVALDSSQNRPNRLLTPKPVVELPLRQLRADRVLRRGPLCHVAGRRGAAPRAEARPLRGGAPRAHGGVVARGRRRRQPRLLGNSRNNRSAADGARRARRVAARGAGGLAAGRPVARAALPRRGGLAGAPRDGARVPRLAAEQRPGLRVPRRVREARRRVDVVRRLPAAHALRPRRRPRGTARPRGPLPGPRRRAPGELLRLGRVRDAVPRRRERMPGRRALLERAPGRPPRLGGRLRPRASYLGGGGGRGAQ